VNIASAVHALFTISKDARAGLAPARAFASWRRPQGPGTWTRSPLRGAIAALTPREGSFSSGCSRWVRPWPRGFLGGHNASQPLPLLLVAG